jgi:AraC-like DNA-binding protein
MSILTPEFEYVDRAVESVRYLEHGWPTNLCRWHSHEEYELHLIVATKGKAFVGDYIGDFGPGSLFLCGPNLPHNWVTDDIGAPEVVDTRDMLFQFNQVSVDSLKEGFPEFRELDELLERSRGGIEFANFDLAFARKSLTDIRNAYGAMRVLKAMSFLLMIKDHPSQKRLSVANVSYPNFKTSTSSIAEVVDFITEHFAEDISLSKAADMAAMSQTAFARNFQKFTGSKFSEFVTRVRIGQACSMLQATDLRVATICHEVGYNNLANFNRHFLKIKQMTPSNYRDFVRRELLADRDVKR